MARLYVKKTLHKGVNRCKENFTYVDRINVKNTLHYYRNNCLWLKKQVFTYTYLFV